MILLLGQTGYVGRAFEREMRERGLAFYGASRDHGDLSRPGLLRSLLEKVEPEFVINAAGWPGTPNVDATEIEKARCLSSNVVIPLQLAELCAERDIPVGHVSTGCIFRGQRPDGGGFTEEDSPNFDFTAPTAGWYSGCKGLAEQGLRSYEKVYQWRLRMPFDHRPDPRNLLSKFLRYERLFDARNSLSHLDEFIQACLESYLRRIPFGTYNVTNPGSITTREIVALMQANEMGRGREFRFFDDEQDFLSKAAKVRRATCVMDSSKLARAGVPLRPVEEAVRDAVGRWAE